VSVDERGEVERPAPAARERVLVQERDEDR
jgi:hypothetical protein